MKKLGTRVLTIAVLAASSAWLSYYRDHPSLNTQPRNQRIKQQPAPTHIDGLADLDDIQQAFDDQRSNLQIKQTGRIIKIL